MCVTVLACHLHFWQRILHLHFWQRILHLHIWQRILHLRFWQRILHLRFWQRILHLHFWQRKLHLRIYLWWNLCTLILMPDESYRKRLRYSLLYLRYVFRALINSLAMVQIQCCFMSTKTVRDGEGSPGRPPRPPHSSWALNGHKAMVKLTQVH